MKSRILASQTEFYSLLLPVSFHLSSYHCKSSCFLSFLFFSFLYYWTYTSISFSFFLLSVTFFFSKIKIMLVSLFFFFFNQVGIIQSFHCWCKLLFNGRRGPNRLWNPYLLLLGLRILQILQIHTYQICI